LTKEKIKEAYLQRQLAYSLTFNNESGKQVLEDLAKFCRANETAFHADPRVHAALEGRREVYLRIKDHLELPPEEYLKKCINLNLLEGNKK